MHDVSQTGEPVLTSRTDTARRDRVAQIASARPETALDLARQIVDPWYRCQALAHVADGISDPQAKTRLLKEAFALATTIADVNRAVSVSAWPLKVLCRNTQAGNLTAETRRLLNLAQEEASPVRRADALNLVLGAVLTGPKKLFLEVLEGFRTACLTPLASGKRNKKGDSLLAGWIVIIDHVDTPLAEELLQSLAGSELRDRTRVAVGESRHLNLDQLCTWPNIARE